MIDESFHLTPLDVRRTEFPNALRGYDKARVDEFRDRVADELERLTRVNQDLENKAKGFHEQLRAFRERDKALNEALVSAQQLRAETKDQAQREAQLSLREARAEGDRLIESARGEARRLAGEIEALGRSRRAYLAQLKALVAHQLSELEAIPDTIPAPSPFAPDVGAAFMPPGGSTAFTPPGSSAAFMAPSGSTAFMPPSTDADGGEETGTESQGVEVEEGTEDGEVDAAVEGPDSSVRVSTKTPAWLESIPEE